MIIIETCPECGHDLVNITLTTYPPIPQKKCFNCGWEWTGVREKVVRLPFVDNGVAESAPCENCLSNPKNGGNGVCFCTLGQQTTY